VEGSALAQGPAQEAAGVPAGALRIPPEQLRLRVGSQRSESKQVSYFDPRQRPIRITGNAAILSRLAPIHLDAAANGMRHMRTSACWRPCRRVGTMCMHGIIGG
jgi:hypothetical protein